MADRTYRVWCEDENAHFEVEADSAPTECPNDAGHTITVEKTAVVGTKPDQIEGMGRGYMADGGRVDAVPAQTVVIVFNKPFTVEPMVQVTPEVEDDVVETACCWIRDLTTVGCRIICDKDDTVVKRYHWIAIGK